MKKLIPFFCILFFFGCKAKQTDLITEKQEFNATSNCPDDGVCSVELIPNSKLITQTDEFGNAYISIEKGDKIVYKYTYKRNPIPNTVDGNYTEEIYAEFDKNLPNISLEGKQLSQAKVIYNRICFCRGQAGFYDVKNGKLSVEKTKKNTYNIQLEFKVDEVPQVITSINETFVLE